MAKYKKELSMGKDMAANGFNPKDSSVKRFNDSVKRLSNFVNIQEMDRRHWMGENFGSPEGVLFKIVRVLIPILSLYTIFSLVIYYAIRDAQYVLSTLQNANFGLAYDADVANMNIVLGFVVILGIVLFAGNIVLFFKKYFIGGYMTFISSLMITVYIFSRLWIPMPEDNNSYIIMFSVSCGIYFIQTLLCGYILLCKYKVKHTVKKQTDIILGKISRGANELLSPDDYCVKIDKYIEKEKAKIVKEMKNRDHDFLHFDYQDDADDFDDIDDSDTDNEQVDDDE